MLSFATYCIHGWLGSEMTPPPTQGFPATYIAKTPLGRGEKRDLTLVQLTSFSGWFDDSVNPPYKRMVSAV